MKRPNGRHAVTHLDRVLRTNQVAAGTTGAVPHRRADVTADLFAVLTEEGLTSTLFSTLTLELLLNMARRRLKGRLCAPTPKTSSRASLSDPTSGAHRRQLFPVKSCRIQSSEATICSRHVSAGKNHQDVCYSAPQDALKLFGGFQMYNMFCVSCCHLH